MVCTTLRWRELDSNFQFRARLGNGFRDLSERADDCRRGDVIRAVAGPRRTGRPANVDDACRDDDGWPRSRRLWARRNVAAAHLPDDPAAERSPARSHIDELELPPGAEVLAQNEAHGHHGGSCSVVMSLIPKLGFEAIDAGPLRT